MRLDNPDEQRALIARNKHMTYSEVLFLLPHLTVVELETIRSIIDELSPRRAPPKPRRERYSIEEQKIRRLKGAVRVMESMHRIEKQILRGR